VFFRSKSADPVPPTDDENLGAISTGKGHATPKRKAAEALNRRPLVPADRKAAGKTDRAAARTLRDREYQAMQSGDERYLPAKHQGPVLRFVRDHVDARWNLGEFFLPIAMTFVVATFFFSKNQAAAAIIILILYAVVIITVIDAAIMWRTLKKRLALSFGDRARVRGVMMYAVMRAFQIRRARLPKPQVKHGEYPVA